jgi:hypothetical protein
LLAEMSRAVAVIVRKGCKNRSGHHREMLAVQHPEIHARRHRAGTAVADRRMLIAARIER